MDNIWAPSGTNRLDFVILPEFPLYGLVPAIEALRIANQNAGARLYDWRLISVDGATVTSSGGISLPMQGTIADVPFSPLAFVCAGNHPLQNVSRPLVNWLRRLDRHGAILGAIDTGAFALAEAELLSHHAITLHWEASELFRKTYPGIDVREQLYLFDTNRITCAGGHATLDMILHLIRLGHGTALAQVVANAFVSPDLRDSSDPQRFAPVNRDETTLIAARVIRLMERNLSEPLDSLELAARARINPRTLSRVFRRSLGETPMRYYLKLRLQTARNDLFYTTASVEEIAERYGFSHVEVFSRTFRAYSGMSPSAYRRNVSREELKRFRPELGDAILRPSEAGGEDGAPPGRRAPP